MKKQTIIIFLMLALFKVQAQDYLISFAGAGDTNVLSTIYIGNLTSGATVNLDGADILHLTTSVVGLPDIEKASLKVFPNPMVEQSTLTFAAPENGTTVISIVDLSGRPIYQISTFLSSGSRSFSVSGISQGMYFIKITGKNYSYTSKLISIGSYQSKVRIEDISSVNIKTSTPLKSTSSAIDMPYAEGDLLLFKGISGQYSTIVTDIPTGSKTVTFNFTACADADSNNYSTVTIGSQVWMAENLKTTKYIDGTSIPLVTAASSWETLKSPGYCWYKNDEATNKSTYGAIYNWFTINTRKLCPTGWHIPKDAEWKQLEMTLGMTQAQADSNGLRGIDQGTQLKNTSGWNNNGNGTNTSGFSALPGGNRDYSGNFSKLGNGGDWWSATDYVWTAAWHRELTYNSTKLGRFSSDKVYGYSVRCVKD